MKREARIVFIAHSKNTAGSVHDFEFVKGRKQQRRSMISTIARCFRRGRDANRLGAPRARRSRLQVRGKNCSRIWRSLRRKACSAWSTKSPESSEPEDPEEPELVELPC